MQNLNDLFYFSQVVTHGGFAAAGRALHMPKSKLSRRVAELEKRLGAQLIERSSRRFRVTPVGAVFHEHCRIAMNAAERAEAVVVTTLDEPEGIVRFSCPTGMVEVVTPMLDDFLSLYPRVRMQLVATDRPVDLIDDRIDLALRVRVKLDPEAAMTVRTLARSRRILLASPALANTIRTQDIAALATLPTISSADDGNEVTWTLEGPAGQIHTVTHIPRLGCSDIAAVRSAVMAGIGVAILPDHSCAEALRSGALVRIFPDWHGQVGIVHLVFTTRTGLPRPVRAWFDHLVDRFLDPQLFVDQAA